MIASYGPYPCSLLLTPYLTLYLTADGSRRLVAFNAAEEALTNAAKINVWEFDEVGRRLQSTTLRIEVRCVRVPVRVRGEWEAQGRTQLEQGYRPGRARPLLQRPRAARVWTTPAGRLLKTMHPLWVHPPPPPPPMLPAPLTLPP